MKRWMAAAAVAGLALTACGGDDEIPAGSAGSADATVDEADTTDGDGEEPGGDASTDDAAGDDTDDGSVDDETGADSDSADDDTDTDTDTDTDSVGSVGPIRSIDDVPAVCREQMASFLREIEPIVSDIDWQTATLQDFEAIAADFQAISEQFDEVNTDNGCNDLEFEGGDEFELMIEFAEQEAPGTVGFFEFLSGLGFGDIQTGGGDDGETDGGETDGGETEGGEDADGGFTDCAGAIDFVQGLIDEYDSFADVPAAELMQFGQLGVVFATCTPEQQAFFESEAVEAFLGG